MNKAEILELAGIIRNAQGCGLTIDGERVFCDDPRSECSGSCECREAADAALSWFREYLGREETVEAAARGVADGLADFGNEPRVSDEEWGSEAMIASRGMFSSIARAALTSIGGQNGGS